MKTDKKDIPWAETVAVVYLALPLLLFFSLYTRAIVAIAASLTLLTCFWHLVQRTQWSFPKEERVVMFYLTAIAAIWLGLGGGLGGLSQNTDWVKHYSVLNFIAQHSQDHFRNTASGSYEVMRYYLGWYIVPALGIKALGQHGQTLLSGIWTLLGLVIFFKLLADWVGTTRSAIIAPIIFILFSGWDVIGRAITHFQVPLIFHYEWWAGWAQYSASTTSLLWVPQHAIASWLGAVLLARQTERPTLLPFLALLFSAILFWSPFAAMGLVPFALLVTFQYRVKPVVLDWRTFSSLVFLALPLAVYLLSGATAVQHGPIWRDTCIFRNAFPGAPCFTWCGYVEFIAVEVLAPILLLALTPACRTPLMWLAAGSLVLIPLYKIGFFDDFAMRASMPALAVLAMYLGRTATKSEGWQRYGILLIMVLGIATPVGEIARGFYPPKIYARPTSVFNAPRGANFLEFQYFSNKPIWLLR